MTITATERRNPPGGEPDGLQNATAERVLKVPKSQPECKSYKEAADEFSAKEYEWIQTPEGQSLSDELDRAMTLGFGIGQHWRNMYHKYGRQAAALELMYEKSTAEFEQIRRREQQAKEKHCLAVSVDLDQYLEERGRVCKRGTTNGELKELDAAFVERQEAKGHSAHTWLDDSGKTIARQIEYLQGMESFWAETRLWEAKKKRLADQEEAKKQRKKDEADQRQADKFAKAVRAEAEKFIIELVAAGVLHVGK